MPEKPNRSPFFKILKLAVLTPAGIMVGMTGYSLLIGWTLITYLVWWLIFAPFLAFFLSRKFGAGELWQCFVALLCYYGWNVFMSYKHFGTDYFNVMLATLLYNSLVMAIVMFSQGRAARSVAGR